MGDLEEVPGSWLWIGTVLAIVLTWGVNQVCWQVWELAWFGLFPALIIVFTCKEYILTKEFPKSLYHASSQSIRSFLQDLRKEEIGN